MPCHVSVRGSKIAPAKRKPWRGLGRDRSNNDSERQQKKAPEPFGSGVHSGLSAPHFGG